MILGIGTDIVLISRMHKTWADKGRAFLTRCYTEAERDYILSCNNPDLIAARMAKRWAAKEAAAKALGTGIRGDIRLIDIAVENDDFGCPQLRFYGGALQELEKRAQGLGDPAAHISLSDDGDMAQAFVILSVMDSFQQNI